MNERDILEKLIEKSGMGLSEFAKAVSKPQPRISEWVNGKRKPKLSTINKMAEKLGYKIDVNII